MKPPPPETRRRRADDSEPLAGNDANLLNGLPYPTAVFRTADGCLIRANHGFFTYLQWPGEKKSQSGATASVGLQTSLPGSARDLLYMRMLGNGIIELVSPDGFRSTIVADVRPILFNGRDAWLVTVAIRDLRVLYEKENDREEDNYRALIEDMRDIVYTTDRNATVTYISPNIFPLSGYLPDEVIGRRFTDFVHPEDVKDRVEQFLEFMGGADKPAEFRLITKMGEDRWAHASASPIVREGRVIGVQGILFDITHRKEIEEALRRSEEKYRNVVLNSMDAIFVVQDEYLQFINPSASKILGHTLEEVADRPFWEFIHPDNRAEMISRYHLRLRGKSTSDRSSFRIQTKSGDLRHVELNAVTIAWEGKPGVLCFLRDVTVQKKMEAQLRGSQKIEALGALSSGITHNFSNLLMGIHGNVSLCLADTPPGTPAHQCLKKVINLVQSGSRLTRQLLGYIRCRPCDMDTVDLTQLVTEAVDTLTATQKQIQVFRRLSDEIPPIKADKGQVEQVLLNLLLNAADAMPDGGDVRIETACLRGDQAETKAALSEDMFYAQIKVSDTGLGIPRNIIQRIFEPFFTTKGMGSRTGLGLSIAYDIVKNHHGDICVTSTPGKGTTFFIYLPLIPADPALAVVDAEPQKIAGRGTILFVEDEPAVLGPTARLLEQLGFSVLRADCGLMALEIFQNQWREIDLVILDMILPKMGGKDLFYRFREINPQVRVLLSSGYSLSSQAETLIENGCLGFLQKPYTMDTLSSMMMEILAHR